MKECVTIYTQQVEDLDLVAVIQAVNKVGADEKGGQQTELGGDCGEGTDGQIAGEAR